MSTKKPNTLKTPWKAEAPSRFGVVRIVNVTGAEVTTAKQAEAEAIVRAVNWCAQRGYLK